MSSELPESRWTWHRPWSWATPPRCAVFDFDGTLSLVRGGWTDIMVSMMVDQLRTLSRTTEDPRTLQAYVRHYVLGLNGKPTIYQMRRFAEEISARGGQPDDPSQYHREYLRRLGLRVEERKARIRSGDATPDDLLVPGARSFLTALANAGVELTLASGTEIEFIQEESRILQIADFFEGRIFGPGIDPAAFSKRQVMRDLLSRHGITGQAFIGVGDGVVETLDASELGGLSIGVASDELHRSGQLEPWKRDRLVESGAHLIIPDYADAEELTNHLLKAR
ncbi:MAG TPA: HAD family hydrolase [Planctomycetaceae bacterium]|nr:HAD family hydrolase [Planctomycetaceae bacterium]